MCVFCICCCDGQGTFYGTLGVRGSTERSSLVPNAVLRTGSQKMGRAGQTVQQSRIQTNLRSLVLLLTLNVIFQKFSPVSVLFLTDNACSSVLICKFLEHSQPPRWATAIERPSVSHVSGRFNQIKFNVG